MTALVAEPWLSASISAPAAWAAFTAVQQLSWSLRVASWSPLKLEVDHDYEFQACLDEAGSFAFDKRARGEIALRILTITDGFDERKLRVRNICPERLRTYPSAQSNALAGLRDAIISRLRDELNQRFDNRPQTWADRVKALVAGLPQEEGRAASLYMGIDQELTEKECVAGLNYAFTTLEPQLHRTANGLSLLGHPRKLKEVRAARHHPDPKARARNLALRAIEARLVAMDVHDQFDDILLDLSLDDLLPLLREELRGAVKLQGCWALVDTAIRRDRVAEGLVLPESLPPEIWDLIRQQEARIDRMERTEES